MLDDEIKSRTEIHRNAPGRRKAYGARRIAVEVTDEILWQLRYLARLLVGRDTMAGVLGVSLSAFQDFLEQLPEAVAEIEQGIAEGKVRIRRAQFRVAEKDSGMAVFLAKNYLLQSDKTGTGGRGAIQIVIDQDGGTEIEKNAGGKSMARVCPRFANEATDEMLWQLRYLARLHCPQEEMAGFLRISLSSFRAFLNRSPEASEAIEQGLAEGKLKIRRALLRHAKRNGTVAMFLAEQNLLASDNAGASNGGAIRIIVVDADKAAA
ncbi:hypothetical protein [Mesorhizobium xinjiangense]|uniref:hypothetical protein n=1 Tax=Mesorhizobium xinjiangense TaxID=2678685 RepID=UPI0012ED1ABD|nr:hypothetical protein [Mesorhizobium xinjiangense]